MPTRRQERINDLIHEELSLLVPGRLDDPRLTDVKITRVEVTQDLSTAKVYFTCVAADSDDPRVMAALEQAKGFLRGELSSTGLRRLPQLVFARDRGYESGERVLDILDRLHHVDDGDDAVDDHDASGDAVDDHGDSDDAADTHASTDDATS
jgi:ribosome-binding factor A